MKSVNKYWIYGYHTVQAALANPARTLHNLITTKQMHKEFANSFPQLQIHDKSFFDKKFGAEVVHQGIAAEVTPLEPLYLQEFVKTAREDSVILILDQVTDPHNIGAILRTAAAMQVDAILLPDRNSPMEGPVMAKTASGALELVPIIRETNLARAMGELKEQNFWCYGFAEGNNTALHKNKLNGRIALVMGAEGKGMRRLTKEHCDVLVHIPTSEQFSTLNVSNAAAIAMYEAMRQRE